MQVFIHGGFWRSMRADQFGFWLVALFHSASPLLLSTILSSQTFDLGYRGLLQSCDLLDLSQLLITGWIEIAFLI